MSRRLRAYRLLEQPERGRMGGQVLEGALIVLIAANVLSVTLETVPEFHAIHAVSFHAFELFSVAIFTVEYLARIWVAAEAAPDEPAWKARLRYMRSPMALVDLAAILPFYLHAIMPLDLRILRVLRLLRILKLTRYSAAMGILQEVFREEMRTFLAGIFVLFILLMLAASGAWLAEHRAQPDAFGSIPAAMWWAMATLTTVGYGDVTPITIGGKIFGGVVTVIGVGMAALPAGILASGFNDHLKRRRLLMRAEFRLALEDGIIDIQEGRALEELRRKLGISRESADVIYHEVLAARRQGGICTCPRCGHQFEAPAGRAH